MTFLPLPSAGLYAITRDGHENPYRLAKAVAAAIGGGAAMVQYRAKNSSARLAEARAVGAVCASGGVPFIVNDDIELAAEVGADGVHLGKNDPEPEQARRILGLGAIIGVSCYASVERAVAAVASGASYVAFGRFFPSVTKPGAPCAALTVLGEARKRVRVPIVAIGGITPENGATLIRAGADWLAVIEGIFGHADPKAAASAFAPLFVRAPSAQSN